MRIECRLPLGVWQYDTVKNRPVKVDSIIHGKQAREAEIDLFLAELDKLETDTELYEDTWYTLLDYVTDGICKVMTKMNSSFRRSG